MAEREITLAPLLAALRDLAAWLQNTRVPGAVIGGVAASLLGRPQVTRDIDAMILLDEGEWSTFLARGADFGFVPRLSDTLAFAHQARVLLLDSPGNTRDPPRSRYSSGSTTKAEKGIISPYGWRADT